MFKIQSLGEKKFYNKLLKDYCKEKILIFKSIEDLVTKVFL